MIERTESEKQAQRNAWDGTERRLPANAKFRALMDTSIANHTAKRKRGAAYVNALHGAGIVAACSVLLFAALNDITLPVIPFFLCLALIAWPVAKLIDNLLTRKEAR